MGATSVTELRGWDKAFETAHETVAETVPVFHQHPVIGTRDYRRSAVCKKSSSILSEQMIGSVVVSLCEGQAFFAVPLWSLSGNNVVS